MRKNRDKIEKKIIRNKVALFLHYVYATRV